MKSTLTLNLLLICKVDDNIEDAQFMINNNVFGLLLMSGLGFN